MTAPPRPISLSPSRASDFRSCPLKWRLRAVDRIPEESGEAQVRGTVVHGALELLYGLPADERTEEAVRELVDPAADSIVEERPDHAELATQPGLRDEARKLAARDFTLETPQTVKVEAVERAVKVTLDTGVPLKGFIDRTDRDANGDLVVSDYKAGKSPGAKWEQGPMGQLKTYGLLTWLTTGEVPALLRLLYLGNTETLEWAASEAELKRFSRILTALWQAMLRGADSGDYRPNPGPLCKFCSFHSLCPAQGGTPPPYPGWPALEVSA